MPKKHCMTGQFPWQNIKMLSEYVLQKSILPPEADCGSKSKNRRRVRQESMPERQETLRGIKSISCWDSIFFSLLKQRVDRIRHHHYTGLIYFQRYGIYNYFAGIQTGLQILHLTRLEWEQVRGSPGIWSIHIPGRKIRSFIRDRSIFWCRQSLNSVWEYSA